jgi:hypothetical protein
VKHVSGKEKKIIPTHIKNCTIIISRAHYDVFVMPGEQLRYTLDQSSFIKFTDFHSMII